MQDMINGRCGWCGTDELYVKYHDQEWGKLVTDDKTLFEFLVLESAQAGLSWITILRKREGYRKAFCDFDAGRVAQMTDHDVERLMRFDGIVRNRLKIKSTITNARLFLAIQEEFGSFYNYTLSFFPDRKPIINTFRSLSEIPVSSPQADKSQKPSIPVLGGNCRFILQMRVYFIPLNRNPRGGVKLKPTLMTNAGNTAQGHAYFQSASSPNRLTKTLFRMKHWGLFFLALCCAACHDDEPAQRYYITLDEDEIRADYSGIQQRIAVSANCDWTIRNIPQWCISKRPLRITLRI